MAPEIRFDHLLHLSTPTGLYEHALGSTPRVEHGFCVDDVARGLVVTARQLDAPADVRGLTEIYLAFVLDALEGSGRMHNRRDCQGAWLDVPSTDDHWGRAVWALAVAATTLDDPAQASRAHAGAAKAIRARSPHPRAMAYAAVGAGLLLRADPGDRAAASLLLDARQALPTGRGREWRWPEPRLTYANAVIPEAMIVVGDRLADPQLRDFGLDLLKWLVRKQSVNGHLSLVPSGGRSPGDVGVGYAQQPIEAAVLAEACDTAYVVTGNKAWLDAIERCVAWFDGDNDGGVVMYDPATGGGYDGLEQESVNQNQGAESTLAWLSTLQVSHARLAVAAR